MGRKNPSRPTHIQSECHEGAVENAGCNPSIATKNVSAANNGFNLIHAVIRASVTVPRSAVKRRGKPPVKGAGWPDQKIEIIGAGPTASKKPSSGARIIREAARQRQPTTAPVTSHLGGSGCEIVVFNRFQVGPPQNSFVTNQSDNIESKGWRGGVRYKPTWRPPADFCQHGTAPTGWPGGITKP